jgi:hypothetical protein
LLLKQFAVLLQAFSCRPALAFCTCFRLGSSSTQTRVALCANPLEAPEGGPIRGPELLVVHTLLWLLLLLLLCLLLLLLGYVEVR